VIFADAQHLLRIVQRLTAKVGRRIDESNPMVDARLPDGSRLNVTIPPLAIDGATVSIRRFPRSPLTMDGLVRNGAMSEKMAEFLKAAVTGRISMLISGGTGAGKTTILNALAASVPHDERIVTVEDSAELRLCHPHVVRMETRLSNTEGAGSITLRDLVRNALRMRPDRLLVGEVRGAEAIDMLQAMNTGHEGSFTTIHANDAREALTRLELLIAMGGFELPLPVIRNYVSSGIRLIVHLARWKGGARRIVRITEVNGVKDGEFVLNDVFRYQFTASNDSESQHSFSATGHVPLCLARLQHAGAELIDDDFAPHI
jgi:pilus assembly protein CpaF